MAIADQAGFITVKQIDSVTLPHVAQIINDTLTQTAVITNGLLNGVEGERLLAMQGLKDTIIDPLLKEAALWRGELARTNSEIEKINQFLSRIRLTDI